MLGCTAGTIRLPIGCKKLPVGEVGLPFLWLDCDIEVLKDGHQGPGFELAQLRL